VIDTQRALHKKHGSAVQLGPNLVSLSDPNLLQTLYDTRGNYLKVCTLPPLGTGILTDQIERILRQQLLKSRQRNSLQCLLDTRQQSARTCPPPSPEILHYVLAPKNRALSRLHHLPSSLQTRLSIRPLRHNLSNARMAPLLRLGRHRQPDSRLPTRLPRPRV